MTRLLRWYGVGPLHLLTMIGCFALAGYAAVELLPVNPVGILVWLVAAVTLLRCWLRPCRWPAAWVSVAP